MAAAITVVPSGGTPVTLVGRGGIPMTLSPYGGAPVTLTTDATPITLVDESGNPMSVFVVPTGGASGVSASHTGDTNETALASITIPAGAMGPNGILRITALWTYTNSGNNKIFRCRFGNGLSGTAFINATATTTAANRLFTTIQNRNATNSQIAGISGANFTGTTTANVTGTIDTTASQSVTLSALLASAGETITLESYVVEVMYRA